MELYKGLAHIAFDCADIEASLEFYTEKMGFKKIMQLGEGERADLVYLKIAEGQYLELFRLFENDISLEDKHYYDHLCLEVENIEYTVTALKERGVEVGPIMHGEDGNYQAWRRDPDENKIELMQMMPNCRQLRAEREAK